MELQKLLDLPLILPLLGDTGITGLSTANTAIAITGTELAADLVTIEAATTGLITLDPATTAIKGTVAALGTVNTKSTTVTTVGSEFTRTIEGPLTAALQIAAADSTSAAKPSLILIQSWAIQQECSCNSH